MSGTTNHPILRIPRIGGELWFPDPRQALVNEEDREYDGLVALGGDLSADRLCLAYRSGIFPWTANPITWWSPNPRGIFEIGRIHVSKSLQRTLSKGLFEITVDQAFQQVITECALQPRPGGWITPEFVRAYTRLHQRGHAHSLEVWHQGRLVGGIYGVTQAGLFAGESMFHKMNDASKVAVVCLSEWLREHGFQLFDIQMITPTTERLGAIEISREAYLDRLASALRVDCDFS